VRPRSQGRVDHAGEGCRPVLVRSDRINVAPMIDPVSTLVICPDTSNVD
jgi:hypothetical protein